MKFQNRQTFNSLKKIVLAIVIFLGMPFLIFIFWLRFVHLPAPYYEVGSYEKMVQLCCVSPYNMLLPAKDTIPLENELYEVKTVTNRRGTPLTGYSIHSSVSILEDTFIIFTISCSEQAKNELYGSNQTEYREIPMKWVYRSETDTDDRHYQSLLVLVTLDSYQYKATVSIYGPNTEHQDFLWRLCRPVVESMIDQWYEKGDYT